MENKTFRDSLREEWKKLSVLTWTERLVYIWDYYKAWLAGALGVILAVSIGITIYRNAQIERVLNVFLIGCDAVRADTEGLAEGFGEYLGGLSKDQELMLDASLTLNQDDSGTIGLANEMKLTAAVAAGEADVLLLNQEGYDSWLKRGGMADLSAFFTAEQMEQWKDRLVYEQMSRTPEDETGEQTEEQAEETVRASVPAALRLEDSGALQASEAYPDGAVYGVIVPNGTHADLGAAFFDYLLQGTAGEKTDNR